MKVEQFVMAYKIEQDRIRAVLPDNFESLRPVVRINAEIRNEQEVYLECNTPVSSEGKRGWLNIDHWNSHIKYERSGTAVTFYSPFIEITYTRVGVEGGCPAEKDNDGCFFLKEKPDFRPSESIENNKEFCDCKFQWKLTENSTGGISVGGKSVPAFLTECKVAYPKQEMTIQNVAEIPCEQILGAYCVCFERKG